MSLDRIPRCPRTLIKIIIIGIVDLLLLEAGNYRIKNFPLNGIEDMSEYKWRCDGQFTVTLAFKVPSANRQFCDEVYMKFQLKAMVDLSIN